MFIRTTLAVHARKFWYNARLCRQDEDLANRMGCGHALADLYKQSDNKLLRRRIEDVGAFMNHRAHARGDDRAVIEATLEAHT